MTTTELASAVPHERLTTTSYWQEFWNRRPLDEVSSTIPEDLDVMLRRHLAPSPGLRAVEIGCVPGRFLEYLAVRFGYEVHGVDIAEQVHDVKSRLTSRDIERVEVFREDVFSWQPEVLYDLVCSFGLVEHFAELTPIVSRHAALAKPGGKVVFSLPNYRFGMLLQARAIGLKPETTHNLESMSVRRLNEAASAAGLEIEYCGYTCGVGVVRNVRLASPLRRPIAIATSIPFRLLARCVHARSPLKFLDGSRLAPNLFVVARKPNV